MGPGAMLSHKTLLLPRIPVHPEREDAEKTVHQGDTSAGWGRGPFIVSMCLRERKVSQRPFQCAQGRLPGEPRQRHSQARKGSLWPEEQSWDAGHWDVH